MDRLAQKHGADVSTLEYIYSQALRCWHSVASYFETAYEESRMEHGILHGTADVVGGSDNVLAVLDWKTGRVRSDYARQVQGYAYLAYKRYGMPPSGLIHTLVGWLRFGEVEVKTYSESDMIDFEAWLENRAKKIGVEYAPGSQCSYCQIKHACDARAVFLRSSIKMLLDCDTETETRDGLTQLYTSVKMIKAAIDDYDKAFKMLADESPIDFQDGTLYGPKTVEQDEIDARKAWPVLIERIGLTDDDLAQCVSVTKTALMKVVRAKAPRGSGAIWERDTMASLREEGAVSKKTLTRYSVYKKDT